MNVKYKLALCKRLLFRMTSLGEEELRRLKDSIYYLAAYSGL